VIAVPAAVRIYVAKEPVDLRRGFDGLSAVTRSVLRKDPMSGHIFVFINRRRNRVKLLVWDRTGFVLIYKKLCRGCFAIPRAPDVGREEVEVDAGELALMLEGIEVRGSRKRKRWYHHPSGLTRE